MSQKSSWFSLSRYVPGGGGHQNNSTEILDPTQGIKETIEGLDYLMDDDLEKAEAVLSHGNTAFHKLGLGTVAFLRALLGLEPEMIKSAAEKLNTAKHEAEKEHKIAVQNDISISKYPAGSEYTVSIAHVTLMSAVTGFVTESTIEGMAAMYKSYKILEKLYSTISQVEAQHRQEGRRGSRRGSRAPPINEEETIESPHSPGPDGFASNHTSPIPNQSPPHRRPSIQGSDSFGLFHEAARRVSSVRRRSSIGTQYRFSIDENITPLEDMSVSDGLVYSGTLTGLGMLMLIMSLIPPSLTRILSIIGFSGDRKRALRMLWASSSADNVFGAISILLLMTYFGNALQISDITSENDAYVAESSAEDVSISFSVQRCANIVQKARKRYPHSSLWLLQEAKILSSQKDIYGAIKILESPTKIQMPQVKMMVSFDLATYYLMTHQYAKAAEAYLSLREQNTWSPAIYLYVAAGCFLELSHRAEAKAEKSRLLETANKTFKLVSEPSGKRKFGGRQMPLETLVLRKVAKYQQRKPKCMAEGVGTSPIQLFLYIFSNGYKRMSHESLRECQVILQRKPCCSIAKAEESETQLLMGIIDRHLEFYDLCDQKLTSVRRNVQDRIHNNDAEDWVFAYATYETAVYYWTQNNIPETNAYLDRAAALTGYNLQTRLSLRIQIAKETLKA